MYHNLVVSGGGVHAASYIGAARLLEEKGLLSSINNFVGCSAGAMICLMIILQFNSDEMLAFIKQNVLSKKILGVPYTNVFKIFKNLGIKTTDSTVDLIEAVLSQKHMDKDINFIDFVKTTGKNFVVLVSNVSQQKPEYISVETYPAMKITTAIAMSTCIPIIYQPVKYYNDLYVDGVMYTNFPIEYFSQYPNDTLGLNLTYSFDDISNMSFSLYIKLLYTMLIKKKSQLSIVTNHNHVCNIPINSNSTNFNMYKMSFELTEEKLENLVTLGYDSLHRFIQERQ